jgi:inorganic triphosphatase YgiF
VNCHRNHVGWLIKLWYDTFIAGTLWFLKPRYNVVALTLDTPYETCYMIEIEAKFRVDQPAIFTDLLRTTALGPFTLIPTPGIEYQHNVYFDTLDRRLTAHHYSLRVRDLGRRRIGTVKRSLHTHMGIHTRAEWEVELGANDDPYAWPASVAREQAIAALGGATVVPLLSVHTRRQYMYAIRAAVVVAEISLDEGTIAAGERTIDFRELEVELLEGQSRADLGTLLGHLRSRYTLVPESRGKKTRGLALLDHPTQIESMPPIDLERAHPIGSYG